MAGEKQMKPSQECKKHNEYCEGCPFVTNHGGCTVGQPWKRKFTVVNGGKSK